VSVPAGAKVLAQQSGIPMSHFTLANYCETYSHTDPAGAYPNNTFFDSSFSEQGQRKGLDVHSADQSPFLSALPHHMKVPIPVWLPLEMAPAPSGHVLSVGCRVIPSPRAQIPGIDMG
jgi:hypothetical protein